MGWKGSRRWDKEKKVDLLFLKATGATSIPLYERPFSRRPMAKLDSELVVRHVEVKVASSQCWYRIEAPDGKTGWITNEHVIGQGGWSRGSCRGKKKQLNPIGPSTR